MSKGECKTRWHILAILFMVAILSIGSGLQFAMEIGRSIQRHLNGDRNDTPKSLTINQSMASDAPLSMPCPLKRKWNTVCHAMDTIVFKFNSLWSVFMTVPLSKIDSIVTYHVTGEIASSQVIGGLHKWLFFKSKTDGDSVGDFEGTNLHSLQELEAIAQSALTAQEGITRHGIQFVIVVAPNKENVYWENMPDTYVHAQKSRTDLLIEFIQKKGVNIVSPKQDLLDHHLSFQLYYRYDTHWNQLGAYIGVRATLASWNLEMPELSKRVISSTDLKEAYHYCGEDDLAKMMGLRGIFSDEKEYVIEGTLPIDWATYESEHDAGIPSRYFNERAVNKSRLLLVGDSFRSSMLPALREQFIEVIAVQHSRCTSKMLMELHPDYVIAEYVERYSHEMGTLHLLVEKSP